MKHPAYYDGLRDAAAVVRSDCDSAGGVCAQCEKTAARIEAEAIEYDRQQAEKAASAHSECPRCGRRFETGTKPSCFDSGCPIISKEQPHGQAIDSRLGGGLEIVSGNHTTGDIRAGDHQG